MTDKITSNTTDTTHALAHPPYRYARQSPHKTLCGRMVQGGTGRTAHIEGITCKRCVAVLRKGR